MWKQDNWLTACLITVCMLADRTALDWDDIKGENSAANNVTGNLASLPGTGSKGADGAAKGMISIRCTK